MLLGHLLFADSYLKSLLVIYARFLIAFTVFFLLLIGLKLTLLKYILQCLMSFTSSVGKESRAGRVAIDQSQTAATMTASSLAELAFALAVPA